MIFSCVFFFFFFFLYTRILKTDQSPIIRGWLFLLSFLRQRRFKVLFDSISTSLPIISKRSNYYFILDFIGDVALRSDCIYTIFLFPLFFFFFAYCSLLHPPPIPQKNTRILYVNSIIIRSFFFVSKRCRKSHTNFISLSYAFIKKNFFLPVNLLYRNIYFFLERNFFSPSRIEDFSLNNKLEKKISK